MKGYYRKGLVQTAMKEYHKAITTFEAGLKLDPEDNGCKEGLRQTMQRINAVRTPAAGAAAGAVCCVVVPCAVMCGLALCCCAVLVRGSLRA